MRGSDEESGGARNSWRAGPILFSMVATPAMAEPPIIPLVAQDVRDRLVVHRQSYNYAPAIIRDGSTYHLYWCAGVAGDYILHSTAPDLVGPWSQVNGWFSSHYDVALQPTNGTDHFDGLHTCDPNVLKIGGTFYLYYTGAAREGALGAIGVAASSDGARFERRNGGKPIVSPASTNPAYREKGLTYGVGQPAAVYVAPYVYLSFTDSTGRGANQGNGAGQFLLRSEDPTFGEGIEELTAAGWQKRNPGVHRADFAYLDSFGLDLAYDPATKLILAVTDRIAGRTSLLALDPRTFATLGRGDLDLTWREGPALVTEADKTIVARDDCARLRLSIFSAEGPSADPFGWHDLGYSSGIFSMAAFCGIGAKTTAPRDSVRGGHDRD